MTLRLRLTLLYSSLLITLIAVFSIAVFGVLNHTMRMQVDDNLDSALDNIEPDIRALLQEEGTLGYTPLYAELDTFRAPDIFVQLWLDDHEYPFNLSQSLGTYHAPLDPHVLHSAHEERTNITIDNVALRVVTRPIVIDDQIVGHLQAGSSLENIEETTDRLLGIMLGGGLITLVLSCALGNWLASRALRPISKINETAKHIAAADDLSRRVPHDGSQDELGSLVITINQMLERLEELFTTQRRFIADISHELRTPVTAIQGNVEMIQRYGQDTAFLDAIRIETRRMVQLVGDLMMLAHADAGRLPLVKQEFELDTLVLELYNEAQALSEGRVQVTIGTIDHVVVEGDQDRLRQLLRNLIANALKYTHSGDELRLDLLSDGRWATINVTDTGIGIPKEHLPHIFERFYRVDAARSRTAGGSGLGLAIAQWIAQAHDGHLSCHSETGKGSTFTLRIPVAPTYATTPNHRSKVPSQAP